MFGRRRAGGRIGQGIVPQPKMGAGRQVRMYAGAQEKVRRVVLGYNLAGVGPVVAEVERVGEPDADPGESGAL
jgi:hypothetical protein